MRRFALHSPIFVLTFGFSVIILGFVGCSTINTSAPQSYGDDDPANERAAHLDNIAVHQPAVAQSATPRSVELTCTHRSIRPVWSTLLDDELIRESADFPDVESDCAGIVEALHLDLNSDGVNEILVRGKAVPLCGAVGNCAFWIFKKQGRRFRLIFEGSDYVDRAEMGEQILKTKTNGHFDLLLRGHFSAAHTGFYYYKYDGKKYRPSRCLYEVPKYSKLDDKTYWKFITCEEFYREQGL